MRSVSVVIPVFNREDVISEAIESALRQTAPPDEIVVVDDGSTDGTADRLVAYGDVIRMIRQNRGGVSAARNRGIEASNSEWVAFLDSDDTWSLEKLELQRQVVENASNVGCVHTRYIIEGPGFRELSPLPPSLGDLSLRHLLMRNRIATSTVMARRELLIKLGGFDESLLITQDWDLWLRMSSEATRFGYVPVPLANYRLTEESLVADLPRVEEETLEVLDRFLGGHGQVISLQSNRGQIMADTYTRFARQRISVDDREMAWVWLRRAFESRPPSVFSVDAATTLVGIVLGRKPYETIRRVRRIVLARAVRVATANGDQSRH